MHQEANNAGCKISEDAMVSIIIMSLSMTTCWAPAAMMYSSILNSIELSQKLNNWWNNILQAGMTKWNSTNALATSRNATTVAATGNNSQHPVKLKCQNCRHKGHHFETCFLKGGGIEKQAPQWLTTLELARKQCSESTSTAAKVKLPPNAANVIFNSGSNTLNISDTTAAASQMHTYALILNADGSDQTGAFKPIYLVADTKSAYNCRASSSILNELL
jgi:hypothetical protein